MKLPEFSPEPIREEDEPGYQKEIWRPSWRCFCCKDTGWIDPGSVLLIIPKYNSNRDRNPICQAPGCNEGANWLHLKGNIDMRLTSAICQELDRINRENWRQATQQQFEKYRQRVANVTKDFSESHSLRTRDRTQAEHQSAQYEHDLVSSDRYEILAEVER